MAVEQGLDAKRIQELDKRHVLHSWSVQDQINPLPIAGAEGRYFWDHDGNRYLDFASQLVNVSIGHQHPKVVAAIVEQAQKLTTIGLIWSCTDQECKTCALSSSWIRFASSPCSTAMRRSYRRRARLAS